MRKTTVVSNIPFACVALALSLGACGGPDGQPGELTAQDEEALLVPDTFTFGVGEAIPDCQLYLADLPNSTDSADCLNELRARGWDGPQEKVVAFDKVNAALHSRATRMVITLGATAEEYPATRKLSQLWAKGASTAGLDPYVTITQAWNRGDPLDQALAGYQAGVKQIYLDLAPYGVRHFSSVNEPDINGFHPTQAAAFYAAADRGLREACTQAGGPSCNFLLVAGEFATISRPYVERYEAGIAAELTKDPGMRKPLFWSFHDYADLVDSNFDHARLFSDLLGQSSLFHHARIWITEAGAWLKGQHGPIRRLWNHPHRQRVAGEVFREMHSQVRRVSRMLYYDIEAHGPYGPSDLCPRSGWDSALLDWHGRERPVFCGLMNWPARDCERNHAAPWGYLPRPGQCVPECHSLGQCCPTLPTANSSEVDAQKQCELVAAKNDSLQCTVALGDFRANGLCRP